MELNPKKMRRLVREFGEFPADHRPVIWRYLLNLPQNTPNFRQMLHDVPLSKLPKLWAKWISESQNISRTIQTYMIRMLRWLLFWSPELSVLTFLPDFILPFVRMFRKDPMTCFELLVTILHNWGRYWLEMCPLPPFDLMCLTEQLLQKYGPGSLKILTQHNVNVTTYAWSLLDHGFSCVLDAQQWAQLWDHLLANSPALMFAAVVAFVATTENSLRLYVAAKGDVEGFYKEAQKVDMRQFLRLAYNIFDYVEIWPETLKLPMTCLPQGYYPCLTQLRELETMRLTPEHQSSAAAIQPQARTRNQDWKSFEMREQWLQQKESALAKPGLFSVPLKKKK